MALFIVVDGIRYLSSKTRSSR